MKFRSGLVIGIAIGYVLGARAGRERYEQLRRTARRVTTHPRVRAIAGAADEQTALLRQVTGNGLIAASEKVKRVATAR